MPPKRMSDILHSSSIDTRIASTPTTAPYSSEGPTLPIITATSEQGTKAPDSRTKAPNSSTNAPQNGRKRKRTADKSTPNEALTTETKPPNSEPPTRTIHPSLYEPWLLLPARERKTLEARGTEKVVCVVYSRNQNVKAGINKLKRYLCAAGNGGEGVDGNVPAVLKSGDAEAVIAVSAQDEGTVKVVGIVDMLRRIVGESAKEEGVKWWVYTVLSSVVVPRRRSGGVEPRAEKAGNGEVGDADAMDIDVDVDVDVDGDGVERDSGAVKELQNNSSQQPATKITPVLTVWIARKRIPGWKDVFGEQELVVSTTAS